MEQRSDSKNVTNVNLEKPLKAEESENGDGTNEVVEKLQKSAISNGEPRCSNQPNGVANNLLISINGAGEFFFFCFIRFDIYSIKC